MQSMYAKKGEKNKFESKKKEYSIRSLLKCLCHNNKLNKTRLIHCIFDSAQRHDIRESFFFPFFFKILARFQNESNF